MLAAAPTARAGSWQITYSQDGDYSGVSYYDNPYGPYTLNGSDNGFGISSQESMQADITDSITPILTWVPAPGQTIQSDPPPATVYVLETASAGWNLVSSGSGSLAGSSVSDGLGDAPTGSPPSSASGKHLIQQTVTGSVVYLPPVSMMADSPSWDFTHYVYGDSASVTLTVLNDTRSVTISSGIEPSYYKHTGSAPGSDRWLNQRAPDGAMSVDSVVQWQADPSGNNQGWAVNNLPITGNVSNFNNPYYSWGVSLAGTLAPPTYGYNDPSNPVNPVYFSMLEPAGAKFPLVSMLTLDVTDTDGVIGTNYYQVTWHLPTENWSLSSVGTQYATSVSSETGGVAYVNTAVSGKWSITEQSNGVTTALSDMFTVGAGLVDPPWSAFVAAAGVAFSKIQPEQSPITSVSFDDAWNSPYSTFDPPPSDNSQATMGKYQMVPFLTVVYQPEHYQGDQYDVQGYVGPVYESFDQKVQIFGSGNFTLINNQ